MEKNRFSIQYTSTAATDIKYLIVKKTNFMFNIWWYSGKQAWDIFFLDVFPKPRSFYENHIFWDKASSLFYLTGHENAKRILFSAR